MTLKVATISGGMSRPDLTPLTGAYVEAVTPVTVAGTTVYIPGPMWFGDKMVAGRLGLHFEGGEDSVVTLVATGQEGLEPPDVRYRLTIRVEHGPDFQWDFTLTGDTTWQEILERDGITR